MTLREAIKAISFWLAGKDIRGVLVNATASPDARRFTLAVQETAPDASRLHQYEIAPTDCADCWQVREAAS